MSTVAAELDRWWEGQELDRERWSDEVKPLLQRLGAAVDKERFPQSLLLVGPAGLGRELAAVECAALLNCPDRQGPWCGCRSCERVRAGVHPDVCAVLPQGAARQIRISQIREVVDAVAGRPYEGARRVWILDGAEAGRFGGEAANAFLKTLEEPPAHACFILLAGNPAAVLPTIRSRCQELVLPGVVAVASRRDVGAVPLELGALLLGGVDVMPLVEAARSALESALRGAPENLLRLPHGLGRGDGAIQVVAAAALQLVDEGGPDTPAEELVRLAAELLHVERRSAALNLNRTRQLTSCLISWYRELDLRAR